MITLEFIYFTFFCFLFIVAPGKYILSFVKQKIDLPTSMFLSLILGLLSFTLVSYIFAFLRLEFLIYLYLGAVLTLSYRKKSLTPGRIPSNLRWPLIIVCVLSVIFSSQMILNGNVAGAIYYFGDDLAHLGYISELRLGTFPYQHPATSGIPLRGYHFFYDFLIAKMSTATSISHLNLYFHFMPLVTALLWGFGTFSLLYMWTKRVSAGVWGVFFVMFGGSFGYFLIFLHHPFAHPGTNFGIDQPVTALWNAPFAFSIPLIIAFLMLVKMYITRRETITLVLLSIVVGITPMFKVYAGILSIAGLLAFVGLEALRKNFRAIIALPITLAIVAGTYLIFAGSGAGIFYLPLWPLERMADNLFPEYGYKEKITTYSANGVVRGLVKTYAFVSMLFIIGNLGTRIIGILCLPLIWIKKRKLPSELSIIILAMLSVTLMMPMLVAQTIKVFEMIQITWYYPFFASLFSAVGLSYFMSLKFSKTLKIVFISLIVLLTLPASFYTFTTKTLPLFTMDRYSYASEDFKALQALKEIGEYDDTVLELPLGRHYTNSMVMNEWFVHATAHVPAFGEKRAYLGNQFIVFPNMPVEERVRFLSKVNKVEFSPLRTEKNVKEIISELKKNNIKYIYTNGKLDIFENPMFEIIYQTPSTVIYKLTVEKRHVRTIIRQ